MRYSLHIEDSYTPDNIPMERLAEYLKALAQLLGETDRVHLLDIKEGSVALHAYVEPVAEYQVKQRVNAIGSLTASKDALRAFEVLDGLLRQDGAIGSLRDCNDAVVIPFPGRTRIAPPAFGPIKQDGTLTGQVVRIGGKDDTIPVHLRDGEVVLTGLTANEEMARRLATHYLGAAIRVHGEGTWFREPNGVWKLQKFRIHHFELLDDGELDETVARLRAVPGSEWSTVPDPVAALLADRNAEGDLH